MAKTHRYAGRWLLRPEGQNEREIVTVRWENGGYTVASEEGMRQRPLSIPMTRDALIGAKKLEDGDAAS